MQDHPFNSLTCKLSKSVERALAFKVGAFIRYVTENRNFEVIFNFVVTGNCTVERMVQILAFKKIELKQQSNICS